MADSRFLLAPALVLAALGLFPLIQAHAEAPAVRQVWVNSQTMKFPAISLDRIDYRALAFEYALKGRTQVMDLREERETLTCSGKAQANAYLVVRYQGPQLLFRITDTRDNRTLLLEERVTSGTETYGQGECQPRNNLKATFEAQKAAWLARLHETLTAKARQDLELFISENAALRYEELRFALFAFKTDASPYDRINLGFDRARDAFDLNLQYGLTVEAESMLRAVATSWEADLASLREEGSPEVMAALHRNLATVYFFARDFAAARRHDALARAQGESAEHSWQERILAHERHYILSPAVAKDTVRMANLYRLGRNAIMDAELEEVDFAVLEQALGQKQEISQGTDSQMR